MAPASRATHGARHGEVPPRRAARREGWIHSITRSARTSTEDGIVIPTSSATFWFTVSSKRVGWMIGSSAGFAPWMTLSAYKAIPGGFLETFAAARAAD